ncbi:MAG: DoxX family membrane protein [Desulfuromonadaceae bacterium]|nr:DoxX family membrane protein [Desulfuromonadaceae bacterium]
MNLAVVWCARLAVAGLFLASGLLKVVDLDGFQLAISRYQLLPAPGPLLVAMVLPWLEIYTALLLLHGKGVRVATAISFLLSLVFSVVLASALLRGLSIDCGCFGSEGGRLSSLWVALLRSTGLLLLSVFLWFAMPSAADKAKKEKVGE